MTINATKSNFLPAKCSSRILTLNLDNFTLFVTFKLLINIATMSIAVLDQYLKDCPTPQPGTELFYFYYDFYNLDEFKARFPAATFVGIAFIPSWQWHLTEQGI